MYREPDWQCLYEEADRLRQRVAELESEERKRQKEGLLRALFAFVVVLGIGLTIGFATALTRCMRQTPTEMTAAEVQEIEMACQGLSR